jgi:hypothetical protein
MRQIPADVFAALQRWQQAYKGYERQQCEPLAAAELIQASAALAAAFDDMNVPSDQRDAVATWAAEGGRGAS